MLKKIIRRIIPKVDLSDLREENKNNQIQQRSLFLAFQQGRNTIDSSHNFSDIGFRVFSQGDEDGKILYIFSQIGFTNKLCLDMAFASPFGSNTTNLIINWGFHGVLVEGSDLTQSINFFKKHSDTRIFPPKLIQSWITVENVNQICEDAGLKGEIDFFSLDMDGIDYHLWKALDVVEPRLIVVEYNDILGYQSALTIPYSDDFNRYEHHPDFFGSSLKAFVDLGKEKGYRLVGTNNLGYNAFFVKNGLAEVVLPEISIESCFLHPKVKEGMLNRFPKVKDFPWIKLD